MASRVSGGKAWCVGKLWRGAGELCALACWYLRLGLLGRPWSALRAFVVGVLLVVAGIRGVSRTKVCSGVKSGHAKALLWLV